MKCSYTVPDILGGTPRRCKRDVQTGAERCWQHLKPPTPKKKTPKKNSPKKVRFHEKVKVRKIPPRDKKARGGLAWAEPITDMQAECISSVIEKYGIWDREDLEEKGKNLSKDEKRLINTCLRIMEGDSPSSPYKKEILAFSYDKELKKTKYRREAIKRENENLK